MADAPSIDIDYVANLARIALTDSEKAAFSRQLGEVLAYVEKLNEVDVSAVEPTAHAFPVFNVWHEDETGPALSPAEALRNAPEVRDNMFLVPKVVE